MVAFNGIVLFVMIWWVVLFAVLPWGIRPLDTTANPARWQGAPERPLMWRKLAATTVVSLVLWGLAVTLIHTGVIDFRPPDNVMGE